MSRSNLPRPQQDEQIALFSGIGGSLLFGFWTIIWRELAFLPHHIRIALRVIFSALFLLILLISRWKNIHQVLIRRKIMPFLLLSAVLRSVHWLALIICVDENVIEASAGLYLSHVLTIALGLMFWKKFGEEKPHRSEYVAIAFASMAIILFLSECTDGIPFLGLIIAFSWAIRKAIGKLYLSKENPIVVNFLEHGILTIPSFFYLSYVDFALFNLPLPRLLALILGCGGIVFPMVMSSYSSQFLNLARTGIVSLLSPLVTTLLAWFYYHEESNPTQITAVVLLVVALAISNYRKHQEN